MIAAVGCLYVRLNYEAYREQRRGAVSGER
jgi:hypothetical protein